MFALAVPLWKAGAFIIAQPQGKRISDFQRVFDNRTKIRELRTDLDPTVNVTATYVINISYESSISRTVSLILTCHLPDALTSPFIDPPQHRFLPSHHVAHLLEKTCPSSHERDRPRDRPDRRQGDRLLGHRRRSKEWGRGRPPVL